MRNGQCRSLFFALLMSTGLLFTSCKGKSSNESNIPGTDTTTTMQSSESMAPVTVSDDAVLTSGTTDATKDYPGVNATVNNGEITLTGQIERSKLPALMQSLQGLQPKKINNNLTVK